MAPLQNFGPPICQEGGHLSLLVDPVELGLLVADDITLLEPESNLLLGVLNGVRAVADVAADVNGEVTADGARGGSQRVGGTEDATTSLDSITAFPDHGANGARKHVYANVSLSSRDR